MPPLTRLAAVARIFLPTVLYLFAHPAAAHVKWFSESGSSIYPSAFSYSELLTAITLLLLFLIVAAWLNGRLVKPGARYFLPWCQHTKPLGFALLLLSIYFLGCAFSGVILAPHIAASPGVTALCIGFQALVSILLLLNRAQELMAGLILSLFLVAGIVDVTFLLEYVLLLGVAWLVYTARQIPQEHTMRLLRCALGFSLVGLALTEKLLQPALALNVLQQYSLNFMAHMGVPFSDIWFVLAAGMVELLVGLLLVLGWLVRTTTVVLLALMIASNSYFVMIDNHALALMEFIGHLPVFAVGILLLSYRSLERSSAPARSADVAERELSLESGQ